MEGLYISPYIYFQFHHVFSAFSRLRKGFAVARCGEIPVRNVSETGWNGLERATNVRGGLWPSTLGRQIHIIPLRRKSYEFDSRGCKALVLTYGDSSDSYSGWDRFGRVIHQKWTVNVAAV